MLFDSALWTPFLVGFFLLAALAVVVAVAGVVLFVRDNRPVRLARHQTVRTYYRGVALGH